MAEATRLALRSVGRDPGDVGIETWAMCVGVWVRACVCVCVCVCFVLFCFSFFIPRVGFLQVKITLFGCIWWEKGNPILPSNNDRAWATAVQERLTARHKDAPVFTNRHLYMGKICMRFVATVVVRDRQETSWGV